MSTSPQNPAVTTSAMRMDATLPVGTTYLVVIDTDGYSGNFERQLAAYATGIVDDHRGHGRDEAASARRADEDMVAAIVAKSTTASHDEYGEISVAIRETPGRINDYGAHRDAAPGERGHPAYESVAIFLSEPLDDEQMAFVRRRADEFSRNTPEFIDPFSIRDVYQVRLTVTEREDRFS